jgi:muramoyltetrapeptide carboxypeptidase LdcA involved in peptidoglycan recycling
MKVGLSACSNGHSTEWMQQITELEKVLKSMNVEAILADHVEAKIDEFSGTDEERAADLMKLYRDDSISDIYDISGGDLANGVLKYLDFDVIAESDKTFWGYSDLTTVINAIYTMTRKSSVLWQIKNLVYSEAELQKKRFKGYLAGNDAELFDIDYEFLQGNSMKGIVVGGNIRCFLKLAGTKYWPDMNGKVLLLESYGGESGQIATLLNQLDDLGVFNQVAGVLLGTFTSYEKANLEYSVYDLLKMHISDELPVACTKEIGHGHNSKAIVIGKEINL